MSIRFGARLRSILSSLGSADRNLPLVSYSTAWTDCCSAVGIAGGCPIACLLGNLMRFVS